MSIHPTAIVDSNAEIDNNVTIEAYAIIKGKVKIKKGTIVGHHAYVEGPAEIGENNKIFQFASIGSQPQDISYNGEETKLIIGNNNIFREFVTINRGTSKGLGYTKIGDNNFLMAYSHVAHDCIIENEVILANNATLAGHILVQKRAIIGGLSAIHQFSRIGSYAMIAGKTGVVKDIPPYTLASGQRAKLYGLNLIGLKRGGFKKEDIDILKKVYLMLFKRKLKFQEALEIVKKDYSNFKHIQHLIDFIESSSRGITFDAK
jgi:UDP-N-acetylglucosamine acyltransferase